jgi:hypothetical protein
MNKATNPLAELQSLLAVTKDARAVVDGGEAVDLSGLDQRIGAACKAIGSHLENSGAQDKAAVAALVKDLVQTLDGLADALGTQYRELTRRLDALEGDVGSPGQKSESS